MSDDDLTFDDVPVLADIDSIIGRPNYNASLYFKPKHKERSFGRIVAPYHLKGAQIKCGIADCGTKHLHGYLITTSDNLETNIGKDCGTLHFKADFAAEMKRHDTLYNRRLKVNRILELKKDAPLILAEMIGLKSEFDFLKSLRFKLRGALSSAESARLAHKIKTRDPGVYRYETRTKEEREIYFETNPAARKTGSVPPKEIKIGQIEGFSFLASTYKDEDVFGYISTLESVVTSSVEEIYLWRAGEINKHHSWIGNASKGIENIKNLVISGKELFNPDNIMQLSYFDISAKSLEHALVDIKMAIPKS
ncbi:hypothetical protein SAMN03159444_01391 [Pseudomonas sp. NFACC02]|uniref:hypothetical protein n=1 Tax=Pseudomonas sp. NFACC02 TaxID=1566250 RepID=UPI0008C2C116|nr:hypothetical protein [Pseudomonas sp. NFACC02]SEQ27482.1 hypothetical protein SAMN03159444_01391 [Pseudomonas sp. NFACC02]